jgi:hypothetical protein
LSGEGGARTGVLRSAAGRPTGPSVVDRYLVRCQLRPWRASLEIAAAAAGACVAAVFAAAPPIRYLSVAAALLIAASFACHVTRGARAMADRLAPVLAFTAAAWGVAFVSRWFGVWPSWDLGERTSAAAVGAMLIAWAVPFRHVMRTGGVPADLTLAGIATLGVLLGAVHDLDKWGMLAVTSVAFECAVLCSLRASLVIAFAATLGLAHAGFLVTERPWWNTQGTRHWELTLASGPILWVLGAALARIARRGRSMSVIPLDHPVHADFGPLLGAGRRARGAPTPLGAWVRNVGPTVGLLAITFLTIALLFWILFSAR